MEHRKLKGVGLLLILFNVQTWACINKFHPIEMEKLLAENNQAEVEFRQQINAAVELIFEGNNQDAIDVLTELESKHPGRYETASNLGTAYELNGQIDDAIKWIEQGIVINPESHDGTEWLHFDILTAKKQLSLDANYLDSNSVIDMDVVDSETALKALEYQLSERIKFVQPLDAVVADLYYLQGMYYHREGNLFLRDVAFKQSLRYGELRQQKMAQIKKSQMLKLKL
ncbi:MAG: tetratricopeptide repeat protein [Marinicella sp.]